MATASFSYGVDRERPAAHRLGASPLPTPAATAGSRFSIGSAGISAVVGGTVSSILARA